MKLEHFTRYCYISKYYMETVIKEQKIQTDPEKSKESKKLKKFRREEPEKEPTQPSPKIDTEEDVLEKVVKELEYRYAMRQFYRAKL